MRGVWRAARRASTGSGLALAAAVTAVGLSATGWAAAALSAQQHRTAEQIMNRRTVLTRVALESEVRRYLDAVRLVAATVSSYNTLTEAQFVGATSALADAKLVGASSVLWVVPATDDQVARVQTLWRERGVNGLVLDSAQPGHEHFFVVMTRPLDGLPAGQQGLDLGQAGEPTAALTEARRSHLPAVSDTYIFFRDRSLPGDQIQLSFLLAAPVFALPDRAGTRPFLGWVVMGIRGQDFIDGALRDTTEGAIGAELWAVNGNGDQVQVAGVPATGQPNLFRETTIPVANRQWTVRTSAASGVLIGPGEVLPWVVSYGGALATVLLAGLVGVLASLRQRAEARVRAATRELREAEAQARDQTSLLSAILDLLSEGVLAVDENGEYLLHNRAARHILGIDGDALADLTYLRVDGVTPLPVEDRPLAQAMRGVSTDSVEILVGATGQAERRLVSVSGRPLAGAPGGAVATVVLHDITDLRAHEVELSTFAGVVAHDLKAPLANIAGFAELMREEAEHLPGPAGDQIRSDLKRINAAVVRGGRLIDDLLAYSTARDAPLHPAAVDLDEMVAEVLAARTGHLRREARRPDVYVGQLGTVWADPRMVGHLLDNLIGNALKYVQPGRPPRIDISTTPDQRPGWVRLEIADRGVGIPDADKAHIFEAFYRSGGHGGYAGTGLGLAICRRIVERHGGGITVLDNPGGGSRFQLTLPAATPGDLSLVAGAEDLVLEGAP